MDRLLLKYRRDGGDLCAGEMSIDGYALTFSGYRFETMMGEVSSLLRENTQLKKVMIQRIDRAGLLPIEMDQDLVRLLREDPAAAIRSMNPAPVTVNMSNLRRPPEAPRVDTPVRCGMDIVADSFGDLVYTRYSREKNQVECPICGMWSRAEAPFYCSKRCDLIVGDMALTQKWAGFKVSDLLALPTDRYYMNRPWNPTAPWISWGDLTAMYHAWEQAKNKETA